MAIGSTKQMENLHDSDHMSNSIKSSLPLYPTVNGIYKEIEKNNANGWMEKPVTAKLSTLKETRITNGFTTPPILTDSVNEQMLSTGKPPMGFGFALHEEHCKAVADPKEEHLKKKLDEVTNVHHLNVNNNNTEKLQGDKMVHGMVSFVGD
jgi:hypothetical protein